MNRMYIDRDKLCEFAHNHIDSAIDCNDIMRFPIADVEEVRHAKWIYRGHHEMMGHVFRCSICGRWMFANSTDCVVEEYPYCHCGAKMREEKKSEN